MYIQIKTMRFVEWAETALQTCLEIRAASQKDKKGGVSCFLVR
jgi:hypothetical protein